MASNQGMPSNANSRRSETSWRGVNAQFQNARVKLAVTVDQCKVGGKLAKIAGSTCHKCYAASIERRYPSAHQGWTTNYDKATSLIARDPEQWAKWIAFQITKAAEKTGRPIIDGSMAVTLQT